MSRVWDQAYYSVNSVNPYVFEDAVFYAPLTLWFLLVLPLIVFQASKRLHDFDRPWWHVLTLLIPIWNLYEIFKLVIVKGDEVRNWFGERTP